MKLYLRKLRATEKTSTKDVPFHTKLPAKRTYHIGPLFNTDEEAARAYEDPEGLTLCELSDDE